MQATQSSGSAVAAWTDSSGNGNDASQTNSSNKPTVSSVSANGLPTIAFNGTSQFLQLPSNIANFSSGASIYVLARPTGMPVTNTRMIDFGSGTFNGSNSFALGEPSTSTAGLFVFDSVGNWTRADATMTIGDFQLFEAIHNGASTATVYNNGVAGTPNNSMYGISSATKTNNYIGQFTAGGAYFQGQIAEILVFSRALTAVERANVNAYLLSTYQTSTSASTPAPAFSVPSGTTFGAPSEVTITGPIDATIYVTVDGTTPSTSSPVYSGPINIYHSQTIKAIAVKNGISSSVSTASYTLNTTQWPAPDAADTTPLQLQLQVPTISVPQ